MEAEAPWTHAHAHGWPTHVGTAPPSASARSRDDEGVCRKPFHKGYYEAAHVRLPW